VDDGDGQTVLPVTIRLPLVTAQPRLKVVKAPLGLATPRKSTDTSTATSHASRAPTQSPIRSIVSPRRTEEKPESPKTVTFLSAKERKALRKAAASKDKQEDESREAEQGSSAKASDYIFQSAEKRKKVSATVRDANSSLSSRRVRTRARRRRRRRRGGRKSTRR
jgi:hypothetical protein